jgi:exosortase
VVSGPKSTERSGSEDTLGAVRWDDEIPIADAAVRPLKGGTRGAMSPAGSLNAEGSATMHDIAGKGPILAIVMGSLLIALLGGPLMPELVRDWMRNEDYSHGFLIPVVAAYLLWQCPGSWKWREAHPCWMGAVVVAFGVILRLLAEIAVVQFTQRVSVLIVAAGLVLSLWGARGIAAWGFPLAYLFLMIPLPGVLYSTFSFPLRTFATRLSAQWIALLGIPVFLDGNVLHLSRATLEVVEACSGIRSLISLLAVSGAFAYLYLPGWVRRLGLIAATVPVALAGNILRLTFTGVLADRYGQEVADGFLHTVSGMAVFLAGTLAIIGIRRLMWRSKVA